MTRPLAAGMISLIFIGTLVAIAPPTGAATSAQVKAKVLSLSDMPAGWSVDNPSSGGITRTGCIKALNSPGKGVVRAAAVFVDGSVPAVAEALDGGKGAGARYRE